MAIEKLFFTPIYHAQVEEPVFSEVQAALAVMVDRMENIGMFERHKRAEPNTHLLTDPQFNSNLLDDPILKVVNDEIYRHIRNYMIEIEAPKVKVHNFKILHSWLTKTSNGQYAPTHTHGSTDLSGVYYFKSNQVDGNIFLNSPNPLIESSHCFEHIPSRVAYEPVEGRVVLFPGWIQHGTTTNTTDHDRISLSFNVVFDRGTFKD